MAAKWIQGMKMKRGAFTRQAKRRHMGVQAFARTVLAHPGRYSKTTVGRAKIARRAKVGWTKKISRRKR